MNSAVLSFAVALAAGLRIGAADFEKLPAPSSFDAAQILRDPFARTNVAKTNEPLSIDVGANDAEEAQLGRFFRVTAISIDKLSVALINGTAVAEGEAFTVQTKSGKLRLHLLKVKRTGVVLKSSGTIFNVSLTR